MKEKLKTVNLELLQVPGLRAHMGDWVYYAAFLKMKDIAERVSLADEIHTHQGLRDMIQRSIDSSGHAESIKDYLLQKPQRFFNAIVIGVYGGAPNWLELKLSHSAQFDVKDLPDYFKGALGILELRGNERLFAIDGQHRVVGIKRAVEAKPQLGDEEIVALFVPHTRDDKGMERSRRLFTTLNRYAKPVSKMDIIALDEDDIVAIITRMLIEQYSLFEKFLKIKKGKQLSVGDAESFTSIETLYDCMDIFFRTPERWADFKRSRPRDSEIDSYYERAVALWDSIRKHFPAVKQLARSKPGTRAAAQFRSREGGHLLFRPAGLLLAVDVTRRLADAGRRLDDVVGSLSAAPMDLAEPPWNELLWNPVAHRMITAGENRAVALQILYHGVGGDLHEFKTTSQALKKEWSGLVNREPSELHLLRWGA